MLEGGGTLVLEGGGDIGARWRGTLVLEEGGTLVLEGGRDIGARGREGHW